MGPWSEHGATTGGYYKCNKYDPGSSEEVSSSSSSGKGKGKSKEKTAAQKAKQELDRYLHYYKRYALHEQAGKFANKQRRLAERRMHELQMTSHDSSWIDVQFLKEATEQLIELRRVLKYTYAYAFYLTDTTAKDLFEYNQAMLESHTEKLAELCETPLAKVDRTEVINFTRVTKKFMSNILESVHNDTALDMSMMSESKVS